MKAKLFLGFSVLAAGLASSAPAHAAAPGDKGVNKGVEKAVIEGQALVDGYLACWKLFNDRNLSDFAGCYGARATSVTPGLPAARGGKQIVDRHVRPLVTAFPDVKGEPQLVLVSGHRLASVTVLTGTHQGPLKGPGATLPATGKRMGLLVAHAIESGGGSTAAREWLLQDSPTMMAQLGVSAAPARALARSGTTTAQVVRAKGDATETANLAAARRMYAAFNKHAPAIADSMAEQVVERNQSLPADVSGKAAVAQFIAGFWQMASNCKIETPVMFAAGEYVVAIGAFSGTNDGDLPALGLRKTGKRFKVDVLEVTRWQGGKLTELWPFYDGGQLAKQLGLMPARATAQR